MPGWLLITSSGPKSQILYDAYWKYYKRINDVDNVEPRIKMGTILFMFIHLDSLLLNKQESSAIVTEPS